MTGGSARGRQGEGEHPGGGDVDRRLDAGPGANVVEEARVGAGEGGEPVPAVHRAGAGAVGDADVLEVLRAVGAVDDRADEHAAAAGEAPGQVGDLVRGAGGKLGAFAAR